MGFGGGAGAKDNGFAGALLTKPAKDAPTFARGGGRRDGFPAVSVLTGATRPPEAATSFAARAAAALTAASLSSNEERRGPFFAGRPGGPFAVGFAAPLDVTAGFAGAPFAAFGPGAPLDFVTLTGAADFFAEAVTFAPVAIPVFLPVFPALLLALPPGLEAPPDRALELVDEIPRAVLLAAGFFAVLAAFPPALFADDPGAALDPALATFWLAAFAGALTDFVAALEGLTVAPFELAFGAFLAATFPALSLSFLAPFLGPFFPLFFTALVKSCFAAGLAADFVALLAPLLPALFAAAFGDALFTFFNPAFLAPPLTGARFFSALPVLRPTLSPVRPAPELVERAVARFAFLADFVGTLARLGNVFSARP